MPVAEGCVACGREFLNKNADNSDADSIEHYTEINTRFCTILFTKEPNGAFFHWPKNKKSSQ